MMHESKGTPANEVEDAEREWYVSRCIHGGFHVGLERLVVSLSGDELVALERLLTKARQNLLEKHQPAVAATSTRHH